MRRETNPRKEQCLCHGTSTENGLALGLEQFFEEDVHSVNTCDNSDEIFQNENRVDLT